MKKYLFLLLFATIFANSFFAQSIKSGNYFGFEKISVSIIKGKFWEKDKRLYYPGGSKGSNKDSNKEWFHKITISILCDTLIKIKKEPVYIMDGKIYYSESEGGYYYYKCSLIKYPNEIRIFGDLINCFDCPRCGSADCLYEVFGGSLQIENSDLILSTHFGNKVKFNRQ